MEWEWFNTENTLFLIFSIVMVVQILRYIQVLRKPNKEQILMINWSPFHLTTHTNAIIIIILCCFGLFVFIMAMISETPSVN
jgi:hypothetical protein